MADRLGIEGGAATTPSAPVVQRPDRQSAPFSGAGPHGWLMLAMLLSAGLLYNADLLPSLLGMSPDQVQLPTMDRVLLVVPVVYAGFIFGPRGGFLALAVTATIMAGRVAVPGTDVAALLGEMGSTVVVSGLVILWFGGQQRERERRQELVRHLEVARRELATQIAIIKKDEKRLAAINSTCYAITRSLDQPQMLESILAKVAEELGVPSAMVFLKDRTGAWLDLVAHRGISDQFASEVARLGLGRGFSGAVAVSGEVLVVADAKADPQRALPALIHEGLRSMLIVPLRSQGAIIGTLTVATRDPRHFSAEDVELLSAIGAQVGMAVENARLYKQALSMRDTLNHYLSQVLTAQEEERKRISRELHDETAQSLLVTLQRLDGLTYQSERPEALGSEIDEVREIVLNTLGDLRRLTRDLRPQILDDLGLVAALEWLADEMERQCSMRATVEIQGEERSLAPEAQLLLFRITQEALSNVRRHSEATAVAVTIRFDERRVTITVADDGRGFTLPDNPDELATAGKLGLLGMVERARLVGGTVEITTHPGAGTTVVAAIEA